MKEGCQTFGFLQDKILELFVSELVLSSRQRKSDPDNYPEIIKATSFTSKGGALPCFQ